jgi:hypothetical protein
MAFSKTYEENTFTTGTQTLTEAGKVTVEHEAYVFGASGFDLNGSAPWTVVIDGAVLGDLNALSMGDFSSGTATYKNSLVTIGAEGSLVATGVGSVVIETDIPTDIKNSGLIESAGIAIDIDVLAKSSSKGFTITNNASGIIHGVTAIVDHDQSHLMTVKNQGKIVGDNAALQWSGSFALTNSGEIDGDFTPDSASVGALTFTVTNSGTISGSMEIADSTGTALAASLTNSGTITSDGLFIGAETTTVKNTGFIDAGLSMILYAESHGSLTNSGEIDAVQVQFGGGGAMTLVNSGTIDGDILMGGIAKVTNSGTIGVINSSAGTITNSGKITNVSSEGSVTNSGKITFVAFDGNFTNSGTIDGAVVGSVDDDVAKNTGTIGATINLLGGHNVFIGGNKAEKVSNFSGDDVFKFGGGNDVLTGAVGNDTADGGAGTDTFSNVGSNHSYSIDLDSKSVTLNGQALEAVAVVSSDGHLSLKSFEHVIGGDASDLIAGAAAKEILDGGAGNDFLAGGLGADTLTGGAGNDTFVYFTAKDSGATRLTRDTILDFQGAGTSGGDVLDLRAIDIDSKTAGVQGLTWIGQNGTFIHAGDLRMVQDGHDTLIQGDTNGDGKADFTIDLVGTLNIDDHDILL